MVASLGAQASPRFQKEGAAAGPPELAGKPGPAPLAVLYDQTSGLTSGGTIDQDFETIYDAYDAQAADDFVVPAGQVWSITRFNTVGFWNGGAGPATSVNVGVYTAVGNAPATAVCTYTGLVPVETAGSYQINFPTACKVTSCAGGRYWISIQTTADFLSVGAHYWRRRLPIAGLPGVWENPGDGFGTGCTTWSPNAACGIAAEDFAFSLEGTSTTSVKGDFNGDACTDLVFRSNTNGAQNKVWFMDGVTRTAESAITPDAASTDWVIRGADDFNADNKTDLVFWNQTTGAVEFWLMNGTTRVGAAVPLTGAPPLSTNWDLSGTGDFNGDGKPDIVWRNFTSQNIVVWTMNGTAKLGGIIPTPGQAVDFNWKIVASLDYNNDGFTDFLWFNVDSGRIVTWYMNASLVRISGQFANPMQAGDNNWRVLGGGDYSASYVPGTPPVGSADIVWRNETSGNQVVWHLDNTSTRVWGEFTKPASNTPALNWTIVGPR
jgi:hypothetical protein